jgi:hypothetical protein
MDKELIKECYEAGEFTIHERTYKMLPVPHASALKAVGYAQRAENKGMMIGDSEWMAMEAHITKFFSVDGSILCKKPGHFEKYPEDYMTFVTYALAVIAYPFMRGIVTG